MNAQEEAQQESRHASHCPDCDDPNEDCRCEELANYQALILGGNCAACGQLDTGPHLAGCPMRPRSRTIGFDYENQAWVVGGVYVSCGHPETMKCGCFGRIHAGESPAANAEIH